MHGLRSEDSIKKLLYQAIKDNFLEILKANF